MSGTISELGENVKGLSLGQKVVVNPSLGDSQYGIDPCISCQAGHPNTCSQATFYGLSAPGGGFANEITVHHANVMPVPENVPLKLAALAEPLAVAWHMVRISGFVKGQNVLILGAGPIGLALLMILKAKGAGKVIVSEVSSLRMQYAQQLGADKVVNPMGGSADTPDPVIATVRELTGEGVDISYEASGLQATLDTAIAAVMPGGVIFNVAVHEKRLQVNINDLVLTEKKMTGGISYTSEDFQGVLELLASGTIPAEKLISSVVPLANIIEGGFQELINNKTKHVKILVQANGDLED
jgi:(R,R)-butanediol dehydrogenase/meso-butanediol dehydrogenase/diacetyl reductase